jgi:hypothetical protein
MNIRDILFLIVLSIYIFTLSYEIKPNKNEKFTDIEKKEIREKIIYGLKTIDHIFNKHKIYYTAAYGTLLGAVRHWNIIPWDDDADLNIWRKDYNKILDLKEEFKSYGLILESDWKLIKVYFDDKNKFPFIDLFINEPKNGRLIRCSEPFEKKCVEIDKINDWWWKWIDYPSEWIEKRKRFKFGEIEIWGPAEPEKVLTFWYGADCLTKCETPQIDHISGDYVDPKKLDCGLLPKPQL